MSKKLISKFTMSVSSGDFTFAVGSDTEEGLVVVARDLFSSLGIPLPSATEVKEDKTVEQVKKELLNGISKGILDEDLAAVGTYSQSIQRLLSVCN